MTFSNRFFSLVFLSAAGLAAQPIMPTAAEMIPAPKFPEQAYFRQYFGRDIPRVDLMPPVRLQDFMVGDHLELSLRSYLELVLANNTDIQIQKLSVETFKNNITGAFGRFDPAFVGSFQASRQQQQSNSILAGANTLSTLSQPFQGTYQHTLESGTQYQVGFGASKFSTNDSFATFNPSITSNLRLSFTQPLMRDRGSNVNRIPVMLARSRYRQAEYNVSDQLLRIVDAAERAYWAVIEQKEVLRVNEAALQVSGDILKRSQRELELGAISALEIFQPQQNYAFSEIAVTQSRYNLQQAEDALRRQMGADLDPQFRNLPVILTDSAAPPTDERPLDKEYWIEVAYQKRPDLKAVLQNFDIDDLTYRQAKNRLQPDFSLTGTYISSGRGGNFIPRQNNLGSGVSVASRLIPGGLGDALDRVFGFEFPTYTMGLNLRLPLRDRQAQADLANAVVAKRLDALRARNVEQQIRLEVSNAVTRVESSRASVKQAQVALDFSIKRRNAEQQRYDLGVSTIFLLIQADQDKTRADGDLTTRQVQYRRDLLNLLRVTGTLLDERGIATN